MRKITIELPETIGFVRAGQTMTVATKDWNESIVAQLVMHGATQKIGDAAAGKQDADAVAAMTAVIDSLNAGDWGRTRGGSGEPAIMRFVRAFIRKNLSAENAAKHKELPADERADFLNELYEGLKPEVKKVVDDAAAELMEQERVAKEKAKKLGASVSI